MPRQPQDLIVVIRALSLAANGLERAEQAMQRRITSVGGPREHKVMLRHVVKALAELHAAHAALVPKRAWGGRRAPGGEAGAMLLMRPEDLHRCHYCLALVWTSDRRRHMRDAHNLDDRHWPNDDELSAHYTPDNRPEGNEDELGEDAPRSRREDLDEL